MVGDEESMQRFIRAMKTMLPIRHPNIVRLYAAGKTAGRCWLAMEYVDGESLTEVIRRIGPSPACSIGGMPSAWLYMPLGPCRSGSARHHPSEHHACQYSGLARTKCAKLGDLMLAKALSGAQFQPITQSGQLVGNVLYLSPEQTQGRRESMAGFAVPLIASVPRCTRCSRATPRL